MRAIFQVQEQGAITKCPRMGATLRDLDLHNGDRVRLVAKFMGLLGGSEDE